MNDKIYSRIISLIFVLNAIFLTWAILWKCGILFIGDGTRGFSAQRICERHPRLAYEQGSLEHGYHER